MFGIGDDANRQELARIDGRLLSTEVTSGFTGRTVGVRSAGGTIRVDRFSYKPTAGPAEPGAAPR